MSAFTYEVDRTETRNRLTVAFRIILAIPHLILAQAWEYVAQILAVFQWFTVLFTGKRNVALWNLQKSWLAYYARVLGYTALLFDQYPAFATDAGPAPVRTAIEFEESANRLTNALRIIWVIPAAIVSAILGIGVVVVAVVSWFAILFTGRNPPGMGDFIVRALRYQLRTTSYALLMTDTYPKYGSS